jgi:hypothetical protein
MAAPFDDYTPLELRLGMKSWMLSKGKGRATRKNKKDYGRPSKPERKRAPSPNEIYREIEKARARAASYRSGSSI